MKIQDILKRMETDIYKFILKHEKEMHPFGQLTDSNINEKFVKLMAVLEDTVGQTGEIFVKNINKIYFRKEV